VGRDLWLFRGALILLGFIATLAIAWFLLRRREKTPPQPSDDGREIDAAVATAKSRLASSRQSNGGGLYKLPLVLMLGPEGSTKTTLVIRSGLDPELLAGEVFRGDAVASTRAVNIWYSQRTIFLEAGGKVSTDPARWMRLVRQLHPRRLRAALSRGAPAPRIAVVCFSCEEFIRPNSAETVPAAARMLRTRLSDLALELGTRIPVYAVFTKADRLPHFAEYVRNFSRDEAHDVLGATLPLDLRGADSYAERAFKRIEGALQNLYFSLASKRLKFLPRDNLPEGAASAYEFPREFRKAIPLATEFLVELCRPSQLAVSPVLRGFYFVGVRPVIVVDAPFESVPQASSTGDSIQIGATHAFNPWQAGGAIASKLAEPAASSRKIPQWLFIDRLFPEIVLADEVALAMTRGRRRVHVLRRLLLGMMVLLSTLAASALLLSFRGNSRLQQSLSQARDNVRGIRLAGALPSLDALEHLDHLRDRVETLARYERDGPPWHLRLGLYSGSALYPELRRSYFEGFKQVLLARSRDSLVRELRALPETPDASSDYGKAYRTLKAYLITTSRPDQSTVAFLSPALFDHWRGPTPIDAARGELARKQFDFYARELRFGNPYRSQVDERVVARARHFLGQFAGSERIYRSMLAEALSGIPAVDFARKFPDAGIVLQDPYVVPGAFTKDGWATMQRALKDVDRLFKGEAWVVGEQAPAPRDRAKVLDQVRTLYTKDYISHWRKFLAAASVARFSSIQDGARKLAPLGSNQSPLLAMFSLVSRNTLLDSLPVAPAFQPVHAVTPAADTAKYIGPSNEGYVNALVALQSSLEQVSKRTPEGGDAAVGQALSDAAQARLATKQLANKFQLDDAGKVHIIVQNLLEAPIRDAETSLQTFGPAQLNGKGRAFCAPFQQLLAKYPFNPSGEIPAAIDEVSALLQPGTGALWSFVENDLSNYLVRQGSQFAEKPGGSIRISPSFLAFLNRAAEFATTLYRTEGAPPGLTFTLRPILSDAVSALTVTIDGQPARFTRTSTAAKRLSWVGGEGREATLSGQILGRDREIFAFQGPWAIFKLFQEADWFPANNTYTIEWRVPGQEPTRARFDVNFAGAKPILQRGFFAGVTCGGRITR
jgi:type VI secretion system protein ImpL